MALPWQIIDQFKTEDEGILELRKRGKGDFLITVGSQILMNSKAQRSEIALGQLGCHHLKNHPAPRIMVGGLGMGITLHSVLATLPDGAEVVVAELNPTIHKWCCGPLAELTDGAANDPRVTIKIVDVAKLINQSPKESFDAIILDLYRGPGPQTDSLNDPIYGSRAIRKTREALKPESIFAIWGENPDKGFEQRLAQGGFSVRCERPGKGGYRHAVWIAKKEKKRKSKVRNNGKV